MDEYQRAIVEFYRRWAPFGGPPAADIFTEFGLSINQFYARHRQLTHHGSQDQQPL
nr:MULTISPECIES: hypothetical protein [unclassified Rhodococcus (in: high G+C Gram-positive bacteria)]